MHSLVRDFKVGHRNKRGHMQMLLLHLVLFTLLQCGCILVVILQIFAQLSPFAVSAEKGSVTQNQSSHIHRFNFQELIYQNSVS